MISTLLISRKEKFIGRVFVKEDEVIFEPELEFINEDERSFIKKITSVIEEVNLNGKSKSNWQKHNEINQKLSKGITQ